MGGFSVEGQEVWWENLKMVSMAKSLATLGSERVWGGCSVYMVGPRAGLGAGPILRPRADSHSGD